MVNAFRNFEVLRSTEMPGAITQQHPNEHVRCSVLPAVTYIGIKDSDQIARTVSVDIDDFDVVKIQHVLLTLERPVEGAVTPSNSNEDRVTDNDEVRIVVAVDTAPEIAPVSK